MVTGPQHIVKALRECYIFIDLCLHIIFTITPKIFRPNFHLNLLYSQINEEPFIIILQFSRVKLEETPATSQFV